MALTNRDKGAIRLLQQRYNVYDYWPFLTFTVTCPDGRVVELRKPEGAFKREDFIDEFALADGQSYTHVVRLDRWPAIAGEVPKPLVVKSPFRKPGSYKVQATYKAPGGFKNLRPRLNFDEWPFWVGEIKSNVVTVEVKPAVGAERKKDFRDHANSMHLSLMLETPPGVAAPPNTELRYLHLDAKPIPREPHATLADGRPIGADAAITRGEAEKLIEALAADGFFDRAYEGDKAREIGKGEFLLELWHEGSSKSRLRLEYPWTPDAIRRLQKLAACLNGTLPDLLNKLLSPVADTVPPWGEANTGLEARLHVPDKLAPAGRTPRLDLELRNQGKETWLLTSHPSFVEFEIDGQWYVHSSQLGEVLSSVFKPGDRTDRPIDLTLDEKWRLQDRRGEVLVLKPGKHTVRAAYLLRQRGPKVQDTIRVISNAVEIEIEK